MGFDEDVDFVFGQQLCGVFDFFGVFEVVYYFDVYWLVGEVVVEVVVVLLGEQGGGYQYCYLFVVMYGDECCVYCYFGFVEVDVVVDQVVYWFGCEYIGDYCFDGVLLVWCFFEWEVG